MKRNVPEYFNKKKKIIKKSKIFTIKHKEHLPKFYVVLLILISTAIFMKVASDPLFGFFYTIFFNSIIIIVSAFIWTKKKFVPKEMLINYFILLVASVILFFGFYMLDIGQSLESSYHENYNEYSFRIKTNPTSSVRMYNFLLYFDFSENKGNISFVMTKDDLNKIENIRVDFPSRLNISSVKLQYYNEPLTKDVNFSYLTYNDEQNAYVEIGNFNLSNNTNQANFLIEYYGQIYPFGKFILDIDVFRVLSWPEPTIVFNLNNYDCVYPCFSETENSIISNTTSIIDKEGDLLKLYPHQDYYGGLPPTTSRILHQEFTLNTFNTKLGENVDFYKAIGSGLIVSAAVLFFEFLLKSLRFLF